MCPHKCFGSEGLQLSSHPPKAAVAGTAVSFLNGREAKPPHPRASLNSLHLLLSQEPTSPKQGCLAPTSPPPICSVSVDTTNTAAAHLPFAFVAQVPPESQHPNSLPSPSSLTAHMLHPRFMPLPPPVLVCLCFATAAVPSIVQEPTLRMQQ